MEKRYSLKFDKGTYVFSRNLTSQAGFDEDCQIGKDRRYLGSMDEAKIGDIICSYTAYYKNIVVKDVEDEPSIKEVSYDVVNYVSRITRLTEIKKLLFIPTNRYKDIYYKNEWQIEHKSILTTSVVMEEATCSPVIIKG